MNWIFCSSMTKSYNLTFFIGFWMHFTNIVTSRNKSFSSNLFFFLVQVKFEELSKDDYFSKSNEFATWLKEERGIYFSDLTSEKAREIFISFVKEWNKGNLQPHYYKGISTGPRTAHKWEIKHDE